MKHFLLFYDVASDYLERREAFRDAHLAKAWESSARGELLLGGALTEPTDQAVLFFQGESKAVAEDFAKRDPYVLNGLVARWRVREWVTVAGETSVMPIRSSGSVPQQA